MRYFYLFLFLLCLSFAEGKEIRFPDEELAPESVFPVFENNKQATMNRRVQLKNKLGISGSFLGRMDEPFLHPVTFSGAVEFFFNETHGVRISSFYFWPGLSSIGLSVISQTKDFDPGKVHYPHFGFFFSYALTPFYGKISLATNAVVNLNLSMYFGLGALALDYDVQYSSDMRWAYSALMELNQKVFIGRRFYFHGSLSFLIYHAPNPIWCRGGPGYTGNDSCNLYVNRRDVLSYEETEKDILFRTIVGGGLGFYYFKEALVFFIINFSFCFCCFFLCHCRFLQRI